MGRWTRALLFGEPGCCVDWERALALASGVDEVAWEKASPTRKNEILAEAQWAREPKNPINVRRGKMERLQRQAEKKAVWEKVLRLQCQAVKKSEREKLDRRQHRTRKEEWEKEDRLRRQAVKQAECHHKTKALKR
jgi:hypothetical protein